jgi:hypothetical protein
MIKMTKAIAFLAVNLLLAINASAASEGVLKSHDKATDGSFSLVDQNKKAASIWSDNKDAKVVQVAAGLLSQDIASITGVKPALTNDAKTLPKKSIIIGTIGQSELIDRLIADKKLDVSKIKGQWESFIITTIDDSLIIAGSDRRGTAFGVFTISRKIGVSPLYWWSEVKPAKKEQLHLTASNYKEGSPSIKYRGLFINDEAMGPNSLHDWARFTLEPEEGYVGPKTYTRVFELLLRLKANYCWPAMHGPSRWFNKNPKNAQLADDYAIVMGTSHCEQMLRNNGTEWRSKTMGPWNYKKNRQRIIKYWDDRVKTNKQYENTYTVGLRGTGDTEMQGAKSVADMVKVTQQALEDQRKIIADNVNPDASKVPQILCTYKEVLVTYQNGLEVPDDITLLWADDNHGYTRQLSTPQEQKRAGGSGVYYHLSLLGTPDGYLWLSAISPSLISYELTKAYEYGADRIWMMNVGDIKPAEKELAFSMDLAWDIKQWTPEKANDYIRHWAAESFGEETADDIAAVFNQYYLLAASGKPEHVYRLEYSAKEIQQRLQDYRNLNVTAEAIIHRLPKRLHDAYNHLVLYPVQGSHWLNERMLMGRRSLINAAKGDEKTALEDIRRSKFATAQLHLLDKRYNAAANGKWQHFMTWKPRYHRVSAPAASPELIKESRQASPAVALSLADAELKGDAKYANESLSASKKGSSATFRWLSDKEGINYIWVRTTKPSYRKSAYNGWKGNPSLAGKFNGKGWKRRIRHNGNIWHTEITPPIWCKLAKVEVKKGSNELAIDLSDPLIIVSDVQLSMVQPLPADHLNIISAGDFKAQGKGKYSTIAKLAGLGTGQAVASLPMTAPSLNDEQVLDAPWVEYKVEMPAGASRLQIRSLPNQRIHEDRGVRYAVSIDGSQPQIYDIQAEEFSAEWQHNVIHGYTSRFIDYQTKDKKDITVRIYILDPGLVMRELTVDPVGKRNGGRPLNFFNGEMQ